MSCKDCQKLQNDTRQIRDCQKCGEPVCSDCAEYDYNMVGDPLHYVVCQWICQPCLYPNAFKLEE